MEVTNTRAGAAQDVRRLIRAAEQGRVLDAELAGHAYDMQGEIDALLAQHLGAGNALADAVNARIETFARNSGAAHIYLRLVVTDTLPDMPEYDPSQIVVFDGVSDAGSDFSKVIQHSTIYGTVMTSVNITDLRAYFESGRKRQLLLHMGSHREADLNALDAVMAALPGILAAAGMNVAGMDAGAITAVMDAIKTALREGRLPAAILKALHGAVEIAMLKAQMPGMEKAAAQKAQTRIAALEGALKQLAVTLPRLPGVPPVLVRALTVLASRPITPLTPVLAQKLSASFVVSTPADAARLTRAVRLLLRDMRGLARDRTLPPAQRRELAAAIRQLRALVRAPAALRVSLPVVLPAALARLAHVVAPLMAGSSGPAARILMQAAPRLMAVMAASSPQMPWPILRPAITSFIAPFATPQPAGVMPSRITHVARSIQAANENIAPPPQAAITRMALHVAVMPSVLPPTTQHAFAPSPTPQSAPQPVPQPAAQLAPQTAPQTAPQPVLTPISIMPAQVVALQALAETILPTRVQNQPQPQPAKPAIPAITPIADAPVPVPASAPISAPIPVPAPAPIIVPLPVSLPVSPPTALPVSPPAKTAPQERGNGVQRNPDGSVMACCVDKFAAAAKTGGGNGAAPPVQTPASEITQRADGGLAFKTQDGTTTVYTAREVTENGNAHAAISDALERRRAQSGTQPTRTQQQQWDRELAALAPHEKPGQARTGFGAAHTATTTTTGADVARDVNVELVRNAEPPPRDATTPAWLTRRGLRPA